MSDKQALGMRVEVTASPYASDTKHCTLTVRHFDVRDVMADMKEAVRYKEQDLTSYARRALELERETGDTKYLKTSYRCREERLNFTWQCDEGNGLHRWYAGNLSVDNPGPFALRVIRALHKQFDEDGELSYVCPRAIAQFLMDQFKVQPIRYLHGDVDEFVVVRDFDLEATIPVYVPKTEQTAA